MNTYVPDGGVWTAEERELIRNGRWSGNARIALRVADSTVAALIRALDETLAMFGPDHSAIVRDARALLAALKEEK